MFRFVDLGLLQQGGAGHGYALIKRYRDRCGLQISTGNFYRALQRLMAGDLVQFAARDPGTDPRRAPYEIVGDGRDAFVRWLGTPVAAPIEGGDDPIASRAMFLDCVPRDDAMAVIEEWKDALQTARVALEREHEEASRRSGVEGEGFSVLRQIVARRLRHLASDLVFLDELSVAVEGWHASRPGEGDGSAHDPPFEGCDAGAREDARGGIGHAVLR